MNIYIKETHKDDQEVGFWTVYHDDVPIKSVSFTKNNPLWTPNKSRSFMLAYDYAQDYIVNYTTIKVEL